MLCPRCKFRWVSTTRSNQQNRYYWGVVIETLAEEIGLTPEETHEALKHKFLTPIEKKGYKLYPTTTQLLTTEFNTYIEKIQRWAAQDLSIVIPDPNEADQK